MVVVCSPQRAWSANVLECQLISQRRATCCLRSATEQQWLVSAPRRDLGVLTSVSANLAVRDAPRAVCARKNNAIPFVRESFPDNHGGVSIVALFAVICDRYVLGTHLDLRSD